MGALISSCPRLLPNGIVILGPEASDGNLGIALPTENFLPSTNGAQATAEIDDSRDQRRVVETMLLLGAITYVTNFSSTQGSQATK